MSIRPHLISASTVVLLLILTAGCGTEAKSNPEEETIPTLSLEVNTVTRGTATTQSTSTVWRCSSAQVSSARANREWSSTIVSV